MALLLMTMFCRTLENLLAIVGKLPCDIKLSNVDQLSIAERYLKDILLAQLYLLLLLLKSFSENFQASYC